MFKIKNICKGGGYRYCRTEPPHPKANSKGLYPLHRVLAENKIGRMLLPGEIVHHINGDKEDNAPENLEVLQNAEHSRLHADKVEKVCISCGVCGKTFEVKPHEYRLRAKRAKRGLFCSYQCAGKKR